MCSLRSVRCIYPGVVLADSCASMEGSKSEDIEISTEIRGEIKPEHPADSFYEKEETALTIEEHEVKGPNSDSDIEIDFHAVMESVKYEETNIRDEGIVSIHTAQSVLSETQEIPRSEPSLLDEKCWPTLCRLCAIPCDNMIDIFGPTILHKSIMEKIQHCLPVTVEETDTLSKKVCRSCLQKLESYHQFYMTVIKAEKQLLVFHKQTRGRLGEGMRIRRRTCDVNANNNESNAFNNLREDNETRNSSCENYNTELSIETANFEETTASQSEQGPRFAGPNSPIREVYADEESKSDIGVSDTVSHTPPNTTGQSEPRLETYPISTEKCSYFLRRRKPIKYNNDGHTSAAQNVERQLIKCHFCKDAVQTIEQCHSHARIHASTNYYPCCFCDEILETEPKWKDHWSQHVVNTESRKLKRRALLYSCNECGKKFASKVRLQYHQLYHKRPNSHRKTCDKVLDLETSLQQRVMGVHNRRETSTGNVSGIQFRNNEETKADGMKDAFQCICCEKKLAPNVMLEKHKEICFDDTNKYSCDYCKKVFQSMSALRIHMPIHTRKEHFSCDICPKSFTTKQSRHEHHCIHYGERPFGCEICPKSFKSKGNRDQHRKVHSQERPFSCDICPESFKDRSTRDRHYRIHTGERPYSCDICPKSFTSKRSRDEHHNIHSGERPYSCDVCPKSFPSKHSRDRHRRIHTGERPFICSICGNTFPSDGTLNDHIKYLHSEEKHLLSVR